MSMEKSCKCCKQIWYVDMLEKKWGLCPNCYEYCKPLIDDLKIKDKKIADLQHQLDVAKKALDNLYEKFTLVAFEDAKLITIPSKLHFKEQAESELKGAKND